MLGDYERYIENIRNSLIQHGVLFPDIKEFSTDGNYSRVFVVAEKLDDILYFYKFLTYSGNMDEIFLPLDKTYRDTVRASAFEEFRNSLLPMLKEQLGDDQADLSINLDSLCDIDGFETANEEPEEWVADAEEEPEDTSDESSEELFDPFESEEDEQEITESLESKWVSSGGNMWGNSGDFVNHGADLFSDDGDEKDWSPNGVSLFDDTLQESEELSEVKQDSAEWVSHGVSLFDDSSSEDSSEELFEDPEEVFDDSFEEDTSWYSEDDEPFESVNDQDTWVSEESDEGSSDPDELFEDSDDQDVWVPDESGDVFDDSDDQDSWVPEDNGESTDESPVIWDEPDEVSWDDEPEEEVVEKPVVSQPVQGMGNSAVESSKKPDRERDVLDSMQDVINAVLTSAKTSFLSRKKPKE